MLKKILEISKRSPKVAYQVLRAVDQNLDGPPPSLTGDFAASTEIVVSYLHRVLQAEFLAWTTYTLYGNIVNGIFRQPIADLFVEHAAEELKHIESLLLWMTALQARDRIPWTLSLSIPQEMAILPMLAVVHDQELEAISLYREGLALAGNKEGFRQLLETIVEQEQEHANELEVLLAGVDQ